MRHSVCTHAIESTPHRLPAGALLVALLLSASIAMPPTRAVGQDCPGDFPLLNYNGVGQVACPCFIVGEQAGVVLTAPAAHYPIEILEISIGWGSQFGGNPQSLEQALHLYAGGLPDPGAPIFTLPGPLMNDGFINQFNIAFTPGNKTIASGPFTVALEFQNANAGNFFAASVVHDGNGCQGGGLNVVKAIPGGWSDACVLGVTGDWVMSVVYRCDTPTGTDEFSLTSATGLLGVSPNPVVGASHIAFALRAGGHARLQVFDVRGRVVRTLVDRGVGAGQHAATWRGVDDVGARVAPGLYFVRLDAEGEAWTRKVVVRR
jgi:hypothetical protein